MIIPMPRSFFSRRASPAAPSPTASRNRRCRSAPRRASPRRRQPVDLLLREVSVRSRWKLTRASEQIIRIASSWRLISREKIATGSFCRVAAFTAILRQSEVSHSGGPQRRSCWTAGTRPLLVQVPETGRDAGDPLLPLVRLLDLLHRIAGHLAHRVVGGLIFSSAIEKIAAPSCRGRRRCRRLLEGGVVISCAAEIVLRRIDFSSRSGRSARRCRRWGRR